MLQYLLNPVKRVKLCNSIYLITHKPSGLQYVGQTNRPVECRFSEHMNNYGSILIATLFEQGFTSDDFEVCVLDTCNSHKIANKLETEYIKLFKTYYPLGLNLERAAATIKGYARHYEQFNANMWCTKWLTWVYTSDQRIHTVVNTPIQNWIDHLVVYQTTDTDKDTPPRTNPRMRGYYSRINWFSSDEGKESVRVSRKKLQERRLNGGSTEKELLADIKRKEIQSDVWANRSKETRSEIHAKSIGTSNERMACPVCGVESTRANIIRYHIRGKCADAYSSQNHEKNLQQPTTGFRRKGTQKS